MPLSIRAPHAAYSCTPGQGQQYKSFGDNTAATVDDCGRECAAAPNCRAFDVAKQSERNSCRLYRNKKNARIGAAVSGGRQYCAAFRAVLVRSWNPDHGVTEGSFHANVADHYLARRKQKDYEISIFRHAKTWVRWLWLA